MTENKHIPVLLHECVDAFRPVCEINPKALIVDGTLGGGGHTEALLKTFPECHLTSCDYDLHAIESARIKLEKYLKTGRLDFFHGNFTEVTTEYSKQFDGILVDLGYSTNQLLDAKYGMSFMNDPKAPLDMRLKRPPEGGSAWDLINDSTENELADILFAYGELHDSRKISRKIKEALASNELVNETGSLASLMKKISRSNPKEKIHPATLVFQALRIAVNDELRNLDELLGSATLLLRPGGRIAVITFHSLEDRIVKRWGQAHSKEFECMTKKPITATDDEISRNTNSRSAKLRIYQKI